MLLGAFFLALLAPPATAQGRVEGVVRDVAGALLPGVALTIDDGGASLRTETSRTGRYLFRDVPPGVYQLSASMEGFKTQQVRDIVLPTGYGLTIDLVLNLNAVFDSGSATPVEVVRPEVIKTQLPKEMDAGRRFFQLDALGLRFAVPKAFDAFRRLPEKKDYVDFVVLIEKTLIEDAELGGTDLEYAPAIYVGVAQGKRALILREYFGEDHLREIGERRVFNPPGRPGPYGDEMFYYLIPVADETMILEVSAHRFFDDDSGTSYNRVVEELIRSLKD